MRSVRDIAVEYGQQVEGLLERLGARGPARGAEDLLDQVKGQLDEHGLRTVRRFLRLRNKVIHGKPVEMPMPSREEVERAGRAAVAVLEGALAARDGKALELPGPVYRSRERDGAYEVKRVQHIDPPRVTFYVGPAGVVAAAEDPLIAEWAARRVFEDSGGAIAALPVVLDPNLKEPQGRVDGVMALRDEGAIRDYLRGGHWLDDDEVDLVAGWLRNRDSPVPAIRNKKGRYRLKGAEVTEGRTKAPPAFVVELVPPGAPPRPHLGQVAWRALGWRVVFLPELAIFALMALVGPWAWFLVAPLLLRWFALFGDDPLGWKRWLLLVMGALELFFVWMGASDEVQRLAKAGPAHPETLISMGFWMAILVPGLLSLFRGIWLFWPLRRPPSLLRMFARRVCPAGKAATGTGHLERIRA